MGAVRRRCFAVAMLVVLAPGAARAQELVGRVADAPTDRALEAVELILLDSAGVAVDTATTNVDGRFRIYVPRPGRWGLRISMIGYETVAFDSLRVGGGEEVSLAVALGVRAVPLEPLRVTGRRITSPRLAEYYDRMARNRALGIGRIIDRAQIDARGAIAITDLLRTVPGVRIERRGMLTLRGCAPRLYIDGMLLNRSGAVSLDEVALPSGVEGVEVYRGLAEMPAEYADPDHCGVVLVWTRRTADGGRPFTWKRLLALAGVVLVLVVALE